MARRRGRTGQDEAACEDECGLALLLVAEIARRLIALETRLRRNAHYNPEDYRSSFFFRAEAE